MAGALDTAKAILEYGRTKVSAVAPVVKAKAAEVAKTTLAEGAIYTEIGKEVATNVAKSSKGYMVRGANTTVSDMLAGQYARNAKGAGGIPELADVLAGNQNAILDAMNAGGPIDKVTALYKSGAMGTGATGMRNIGGRLLQEHFLGGSLKRNAIRIGGAVGTAGIANHTRKAIFGSDD